MNEVLKNDYGAVCTFNDEGIQINSTLRNVNKFFPYGGIDNIKVSMGTIYITGHSKGQSVMLGYTAHSSQKQRIKELLVFAEAQKRKLPNSDVVDLAKVENKREPREHIIKCNVCGHIFCYTREDLNRNVEYAKMAKRELLSGVFSTFGVSAIQGNQEFAAADRYASMIIDFGKCPKCNSINLVDITESDIKEMQNGSAIGAISPADEIRKFKDLLDEGIITQEEFDTKKKQLLGM